MEIYGNFKKIILRIPTRTRIRWHLQWHLRDSPLLDLSCRQNSSAAKWNIFFILRFKGPLRFSMFGTRLSFKQFWLCLFLNGLRDVGCRAPFWKPCTFACVPARLYSICFRPSVALRYSSRWKGLHVSTSGWTVFLILRLTRDCIFFPGKAHAANSRSASSSLVRMDWF